MDPAGARLDAQGAVLANVSLPGAIPNAYEPLLATDGATTSWISPSSAEGGARYLRAVRLNASMAPIDPTPADVNLAAPAQYRVTAAAGDRSSLAVWFESEGHWPYALRGARFDEDGRSLDPAGIDIAADTLVGGAFEPVSVGFDGTNYLVAWLQDRAGGAYDVYAARIDQDGQLLDPGGLVISAGGLQYNVGVASLPTGTSVVCYRQSAPGTVYCVRVTSDGSVLRPAVRVGGMGTVSAFAVAAIGDRFFIAIQTVASGAPGTLVLYSMDPVGGSVSGGPTVTTSVHWPTTPAFAGSATQGHLVWRHATGSLMATGLRSANVSTAGIVTHEAPVGSASSAQPYAAMSGGEWLIGWYDYVVPLRDAQIVYSRRASDGTFLEQDAVAVQDLGLGFFAFVPAANGWTAAYQRFIPDPTIQNVRAAGRAIRRDEAPPRDGGVAPADAGVDRDGGAGRDAGGPAIDAGVPTGFGFTSTPGRAATCNVTYTYAPSTNGSPDVGFALAENPAGLRISDGVVEWTPDYTQEGTHTVELLANDGADSARQRFEIVVACDARSLTTDDCGCTSTRGADAPWLGLALLGLALHRLLHERRRRLR